MYTTDHARLASHFQHLRLLATQRRTRQWLVARRRSTFTTPAARQRRFTRHGVSRKSHNARVRLMAKKSLKYPPVNLSGIQARAVARGIAAICPKVSLTIHACAIMPDHVHVVVATHRFDGDEIIACLKRAGTRGMNDDGLHPLRDFARTSGKCPSPWAERGWKVMLFTPAQMLAAIRYVEQNPVRAGLRPQRWTFVVPFVG